MAQPPQREFRFLGHGTRLGIPNEQRLRSGRTETDLGTVGTTAEVFPSWGCCANTTPNRRRHERGRHAPDEGAPRAQNLPPIMERICCATVSRSRCPHRKAHTSSTLHVRGCRPSGSTTELLARNIQNFRVARWASFAGWRQGIAALRQPHPVAELFVRTHGASHRRATCC